LTVPALLLFASVARAGPREEADAAVSGEHHAEALALFRVCAAGSDRDAA
jgi:hypothetical protein